MDQLTRLRKTQLANERLRIFAVAQDSWSVREQDQLLRFKSGCQLSRNCVGVDVVGTTVARSGSNT